jgi:hypothetical protein
MRLGEYITTVVILIIVWIIACWVAWSVAG